MNPRTSSVWPRRVVLLVLLAALVIGFIWGTRRAKSIAALEDAESHGTVIEWSNPKWLNDYPAAAKYWPGTVIDRIHFVSDPHDPAGTGAAMVHFGGPKELSMDLGGNSGPAQILFDSMGKLSRLEALHLFHVDPDGKIIPVLNGLTGLRTMSIVPGRFSGEGLAPPQMEEMDLAYCPITDQGLLQIVSCPKLAALHLKEALVTPQGLLAALTAGKNHLRSLNITETGWSEEVRARTKQRAAQIAPATQCDIY